MARLYVYDCFECGVSQVERVEFTPPTNSRQVDSARFVIDIKEEADHNGYPAKVKECLTCHKPITSQIFTMGNIPAVYFNYMGDD